MPSTPQVSSVMEPKPQGNVVLSSRFSSHARAWIAGLSTACGVLAALLLADILLSPFARDLPRAEMLPVAQDSLSAPDLALRQFWEGAATAHVSSANARLTSHAFAPGAPAVLIVGDSFVAARQVSDNETMGAQLETIAEANHHPVNVRQYGWIAASPAKYILEAPALLGRWHPALTIVVLNFDDFVPQALDDTWTTESLSADGQASIAPSPMRADTGLRHWVSLMANDSSLCHEALARFSLDIWPGLRATLHGSHLHRAQVTLKAAGAPTPSQTRFTDSLIQADLTALRNAYGERLLLVYASEPGLDDIPDSTESALLKGCSTQHIDCLSTRAAFLHARDSGAFLAAGFGNTQPGFGHYNADGHRLIAELIWRDPHTHALIDPQQSAP